MKAKTILSNSMKAAAAFLFAAMMAVGFTACSDKGDDGGGGGSSSSAEGITRTVAIVAGAVGGVARSATRLEPAKFAKGPKSAS